MAGALLTTYEASRRYGLSTGYLRVLLEKGKVKGRRAKLTPQRSVCLIQETSLKKYLAQERKPGPKPQRR